MGTLLKSGNYSGVTTQQLASIVKPINNNTNNDDTWLWVSGVGLVIALLSLFKKIPTKYKMYQYIIIIILLITTYTLYLNKSKFGNIIDLITEHSKKDIRGVNLNGFNMYFDSNVIDFNSQSDPNKGIYDIFTDYKGTDTLIGIMNVNNNNTNLDVLYDTNQFSILNKTMFIGKMGLLNITKPMYNLNDTLSIYITNRIRTNSSEGYRDSLLIFWSGFDSPFGTILYNYMSTIQGNQFNNVNTLGDNINAANINFYYNFTNFSDINTITTLDGIYPYLNSKGINDVYMSFYNYTDINLSLLKWVHKDSVGNVVSLPTGQITVTNTKGNTISRTFTQIPDVEKNGGEYRLMLSDLINTNFLFNGGRIDLVMLDDGLLTNYDSAIATLFEWVGIPGILVTGINNDKITYKNLVTFI